MNRLNKTKVEKEVDHEADRQERLRVEGRKKKAEALERVSVNGAHHISNKTCFAFASIAPVASTESMSCSPLAVAQS